MSDLDAPSSRRRPLVALALTLLVPGLGHWYAGRLSTAIGAVALFAGVLLAIGGAVAAGLHPRVVVWPLVLGVWALLAALGAHAAVVARRVGESFRPTRAHSLGGYAAFIALAGLLRWTGALAIGDQVMETFRIPARSGEPTLRPGDHITITKLARDRVAARGDLITFPHPDAPSETMIKRVVGLPGETLALQGGAPSVDGVPFTHSPCPSRADCVVEETPEGRRYELRIASEGLEDRAPVTIPAGHVYVLGDHRGRSNDSAAFGPIPIASVIGRARSIWLPLDRARSLDVRP